MYFKFLTALAIGVDLGTANTLICFNDTIIVNEPSIVAIDANSKILLAAGSQAKMMHEKTNGSILTINPLKGGVIADFTGAELMIKAFVDKTGLKSKNPFSSSLTMLFSVPTGITEVEKRAVKTSAINSGASEVLMIFEPMASAIGAGLDVSSPEGIMIVDIGGGATQIAIISLSGIVVEQSIKTAGNTFNNDIRSYFKREHNLLIGERSAEDIKIKVSECSSKDGFDLVEWNVVGRDLISGIPKSVKICHADVIYALEKSIIRIEESIIKVLENAPPEFASDIHINGIHMSGGGALLIGLVDRFKVKIGLKFNIVEEPLMSVIKGTSIVLKNKKKYSGIIFN